LWDMVYILLIIYLHKIFERGSWKVIQDIINMYV
jgi:hypothetical protein